VKEKVGLGALEGCIGCAGKFVTEAAVGGVSAPKGEVEGVSTRVFGKLSGAPFPSGLSEG
jgi:hypothetical protein